MSSVAMTRLKPRTSRGELKRGRSAVPHSVHIAVEPSVTARMIRRIAADDRLLHFWGLEIMGTTSGKLLRYDQAVNPERTCCVTFAGVSYDSDNATDR